MSGEGKDKQGWRHGFFGCRACLVRFPYQSPAVMVTEPTIYAAAGASGSALLYLSPNIERKADLPLDRVKYPDS